MRCSACFADCTPKDSLQCVVCNLRFHVLCTSWKNLDYPTVMRLKHDWHCIFCRKNQIKSALFVVDDTTIGIRQQNNTRRTAQLSTQNFQRKLLNFKKTNFTSTFILDDMLKSLDQLKMSVNLLSAYNMHCAHENVKFKKIIGDMNFKLENLCFI